MDKGHRGSRSNAPTRQVTANDFAQKEPGTLWAVAIDILSEIPGITFSAAWKNRVTAVIDVTSGLNAHFISRDDLIAAKLAAGRPRDLAIDYRRNADRSGRAS
jgi:hypothetical protein